MTRVTISVKHARALASETPHPLLDEAIAELRRQLAPRPKSSAVRKTETKRRSKREETRAIYDLVDDRAAGRCEACGLLFWPLNAPELDHFWGRGKARQTVENCWLIHRTCHREKTDGRPTAAYWLERFIVHAYNRGYSSEVSKAQARLAFVRARGGGA